MDIEQKLAEVAKALPDSVELPPRCFTELGGRFLEYRPGESLATEWPLYPWYANPARVLQGGISMTLFDNSFGPFSFLEAHGPTTSLDMQISFIRPVPIDTGNVRVHITKQSQTKSYLHFEGKLLRSDGKLACIATTRMAILEYYK